MISYAWFLSGNVNYYSKKLSSKRGGPVVIIHIFLILIHFPEHEYYLTYINVI